MSISNRKPLSVGESHEGFFRCRDGEFCDKLVDLYNRMDCNASEFYLTLIREGYKSLAPMYLHKDLPVGESVKRVLGEKQDEKVQELINLLLEKSEAETKAIDDLSENQNNLLLLLSVVFNLIALDQDKMTVELYLSKGEAGVPEKFRKGKEE
jgi:hypothetical protein